MDLKFSDLTPSEASQSRTNVESSNIDIYDSAPPSEFGDLDPRDIEYHSEFTSAVPSTAASTTHHDSDFHDDDDDVITTVDHHKQHIILSKNFRCLLVIDFIMIISCIGGLVWGIHQRKFGYPPTEYSETAYESTLVALILLFLVSLFSLIILRFKVHSMAIGYIIMFMFVLTFYTALKGASRAVISIRFDDIATIEKYIFTNERRQGELPIFFHRLQIAFKCCGATNIDKMDDWPTRFSSTDMPRSCCVKHTHNCGKLLGRTYNYKGEPGKPMRMPSGFFLSLTEKELDGIVKSGKPLKILRVPGKDNGIQILLGNLKELFFKKLKETYPPGTQIEQIKRIPNDMVEPFDITEEMLPSFIGCRDNSSIEKVTTIDWNIQHELDHETSKIHIKSKPIKYDWIAWKIPMCQEMAGQPPFHLASNLNRDITDVRTGVKHMWYISRGVAENFILKDVIWEAFCENEDNFKNLIPTSFFIPQTKARKNAAVGKFFISFVNKLMIICFASSTLTAILLFVVFLIFWRYYSRMKLEEFANLPYPQEFDDLKVRQADLYTKHEAYEYDKQQAQDHHHEQDGSLDYEGIKTEFDRMFGGPLADTSKQSSNTLHKSQFIMYPDDN